MADYLGDTESDLGVRPVSSLSSTNPDSLRVFVLLPNGRKLVISLSRNATIHDLQVEALRRAEKYGVTATLSETTLESTGFDKITFYDGEDLVADILDLTEGSTFMLEILNPQDTTSVPPNLDQAMPIQDQKISVRWITMEHAITNPSLSSIPIDGIPFPIDTTLSDFYHHALGRHSAPGIKLFLGECFLHTESNQLTLASLEIDTTTPLNVFVEIVDQQPRHGIIAKAMNPKAAWGFNSTIRGFSTFVTSIRMLVKEIKSGRCNLDSILDVLLELTHFPPLILAFKAVYEATRYGIHCAPVGSLLLIANAMQLLCNRIVPESFLSGMDSALEASRQIIFWIYSKRSETTISQGIYQSLLRSVEIVEKPVIVPGNEGLLPLPKFGPFTEIVISPTTTYLVSIPDNNEVLSRRLGFASSGLESKPSIYFHPPESWQNLLGHERMPHRKLDEKEFRSLIEETNLKHPFRMVGPLQLGRCLAAELPVVTLSAKGYVCSYEQEDGSCSERVFFTWSVYEGRSMLPDNGGGEFLSQKLEPIIQERKQHQNWELEAWSEWTRIANFGPPNEAIVICVDNSLSMRTTMPPGWTRYRSSLGADPSRLDEVKDFFKNLALRISSLDLPTYLGLVTFSSYTKILQALSPVVLNFNESLDEVKPGGSTAIFDALASAYTMLAEFLLQHPTKKCRIILLTDGEDTRSVAKPASLARDLYNKNIVLDTIVVGTNKTTELFKISAHTGGYAFAPFTRQMLYQIFLLETMVDIRTRPDNARMKFENWESFRAKLPDMTSLYNFPPCKPHGNMNDEFFLLDEAERRITNLDPDASARSVSARYGNFANPRSERIMASQLLVGAEKVSAASNPDASGRSVSAKYKNSTTPGGARRLANQLLDEIKAMRQNHHPMMDVYVSQTNMAFWKVVMQGPPDSPYSRGTFLLWIEIGEDFPRRPPTARFVTSMLHPNITKHGRICHPIFSREWTPTLRIHQVLEHCYGILILLEARDAIDPLSALTFWSNAEEGKREVERYVVHFASRSRAQHKNDILRINTPPIMTKTELPFLPVRRTE